MAHKSIYYLAVLLVSAAILSISVAQAQMMPVPSRMLCGPDEELTKGLTDNGEVVIANGASGTEDEPVIVKFWLKPDGEFTVTLHKEDKACMVTAGRKFRLVPRKLPGQPS